VEKGERADKRARSAWARVGGARPFSVPPLGEEGGSLFDLVSVGGVLDDVGVAESAAAPADGTFGGT
jgi:hypothetical protein